MELFKRSALCVALIAVSILAMRGAARAQLGSPYANGTQEGNLMSSLMQPQGPIPEQDNTGGTTPDQIIKDAKKGI